MPKSTIAEPKLRTLDWSTPIIFMYFARVWAPSSPLRLVAVPNCDMASVNSRRFSVFMPSCPPAAASSVSSAVVAGMADLPPIPVVVRSIIPCLTAASCSGVPSTVFSTLAKLFSKSMANLPAATPPAASAAAATCIGFVTVSTLFPTSVICFPASCWSKAFCFFSTASRPFSYSSYDA